MIPDTGWDYESKKNPKEFQKMVDQQFPLGRLGTPEEVANNPVSYTGQALRPVLFGA